MARIAWNKGKKLHYKVWNSDKRIVINCKNCNKEIRVIEARRNTAKFCSYNCRNISYIGKKATIETRQKISVAHKGEKHYNWKGGITNTNKIIRRGIEFRLWREAVFARDNWTCQNCRKRDGKELHPHHLKSFSKYPELKFAIDNGQTLCLDCHKKTENYGNKKLYE